MQTYSNLGSVTGGYLPTGGLTNTWGNAQPAFSTWYTTSVGSTYPYTVELPPWVKDDMLDENAAKKLYEFISGEDQSNITVGATGKVVIDFQPRHPVVIQILRELQGVRLFRGGTDEEWQFIKKVAEDWRDLAIKKRMLGTKVPIRRVDRKYIEQQYQFITKAWTFRQHSDKYSQTGDIAVDAYQVVKDAIRELSKKQPDMATCEYEMLKGGGMILGVQGTETNSPSLIVFFDSIGKSVMDKLLSDGKEPKRRAPRTKRLQSPWGATPYDLDRATNLPNGFGGGNNTPFPYPFGGSGDGGSVTPWYGTSTIPTGSTPNWNTVSKNNVTLRFT